MLLHEEKGSPRLPFPASEELLLSPLQSCRREVDVKFNSRMVYVYYRCQLIATHKSCKGNYHYSTNTGHYPEKKYVDIDYHLNKLQQQAAQIGPHTSALIERLAGEAKHPLKILRRAQGIVGLKKTFSQKALDHGCKMALEFNRINYDNIKRFAKNYTKPKSSVLQYSPQRQLEFVFLQGKGDERNS